MVGRCRRPGARLGFMLDTPTEGARAGVHGGRTTAAGIWDHLRARVRGLYFHTLLSIGLVRLVLGLALGRVRELWIGDSHAVLLNSPRFPFPVLAPVREGQLAWHVGPLLMHSVATR